MAKNSTNDSKKLTSIKLVQKALENELRGVFSEDDMFELTGNTIKHKTKGGARYLIGGRMVEMGSARYYCACVARDAVIDLVEPDSVKHIAETIKYCLYNSRTTASPEKESGKCEDCPAHRYRCAGPRRRK